MRHVQVKSIRFIALLLCVLSLTGSLEAGNVELHLRWQELPISLVGEKLTVIQTGDKRISGRLAQIKADALIVEKKGKFLTVSRNNVCRIETGRKLQRKRGQIIGTAIGAGAGAVVTALALKYRNNENGANSDKLVGVAIGLAVGATLLGYWAGRQSDSDRTIIYIVSK